MAFYFDDDAAVCLNRKTVSSELANVIPLEQLATMEATVCMADGCDLIACSKWVSSQDPENPFAVCNDCSTDLFHEELPPKCLEEEHRKFIAT